VSLKYNRDGEIQLGDKIPDGFYDPGRSEFLSLDEYQKQAVNLTTREILLVDSSLVNNNNNDDIDYIYRILN
jgi:hypothetical protein